MNTEESKALSHTEWSILDYYCAEAIYQALKLQVTTNLRERVAVVEEACKYIRDIEGSDPYPLNFSLPRCGLKRSLGFLINRKMDDLFLLSRYITQFPSSSLQSRVFLRVILAGISQIIFQEEGCLEDTYKMLHAIAEIYIPCLLTQQPMNSNHLKFILGLKTQYLKSKKEILPKLAGFSLDPQLRKAHKRQLKSRREEFTTISRSDWVNRFPWKTFVHETHDFLFQVSYLLPKSSLFHQTRSIESSDPDATQYLPAELESPEAITHSNQEFHEESDANQQNKEPRRRRGSTVKPNNPAVTTRPGSHGASRSDPEPSQQERLEFRDSVLTIGGEEAQYFLPHLDDPYPLAPTGLQKRGKKPWREEELEALVQGMRLFGTSWAMILNHFGPNGVLGNALRGRTQIQLKDKARNEKNKRQKLGIPLDVFEKACD
ncbi:hypothetical protein K493DRAFT_308460 [Basidiobolus meristosporus CBS 931.73]|uniref:HTH myb-type domain-containing protein n=1 Tax=Basidiobolus meristosporus CBS 931.73 TaxID=1314790 RepID=A0A1Y1X3H3_9FUNG|nr:hypothetical protein K493DRAFT_308460 [Basidiobolus meristosporus CBS 931.73]|eukprot:ORX79864.1 hypothetical protein K493DRAFT_308460 [Basidiobolus meristosporus CBS 931.73]